MVAPKSFIMPIKKAMVEGEGGEGIPLPCLPPAPKLFSDAALPIKVSYSAAAACMTDRAEVKSAWRC